MDSDKHLNTHPYTVRPKKRLGQHFLKDENIAEKIVSNLSSDGSCHAVLEIGPGTGVLTRYLLRRKNIDLCLVEVDSESVEYLKRAFPEIRDKIVHADFLKLNPTTLFSEPFAVIGNFPYNISSQILFKILECRDRIPEMVGMFQKEVAERIASKPRTKAYGILSVLVQAFYEVTYLFTVGETVFDPPPRVKSAVIRLTRRSNTSLGCDEKLFFKVVKSAFNQRRKVLRNSLRAFTVKPEFASHPFFTQRAEELSVADFVKLVHMLA